MQGRLRYRPRRGRVTFDQPFKDSHGRVEPRKIWSFMRVAEEAVNRLEDGRALAVFDTWIQRQKLNFGRESRRRTAAGRSQVKLGNGRSGKFTRFEQSRR